MKTYYFLKWACTDGGSEVFVLKQEKRTERTDTLALTQKCNPR